MSNLDFIVLFGYFGLLIVIGIICSFAIREQEDFFLGGRTFGKLLQTFAAFGAGTGAQDPINQGRTTWTSGLSGIWIALCWLFVTPFYWIFAVWYRRMRHLTLGDWFVERYQTQFMGVAYTIFAFSFQILYLSVMFSAIGKVVEPLIGETTIQMMLGWIGSDNPEHLKYLLVPTTAVVVLLYGILGGLKAAYWTDLLQGLGIIALSVILIPTGLQALVDKYGDQYPQLSSEGRELTTSDGFTIMHDRLDPSFFQLFDTPQAGEFPLHYIIALIAISLMGIVIQPHFIATGGGSAKTELSARVGLVSGNFLKRLCTVGWGLTGLIAVALFASSQELASDPDKVWGVASREILAPLQMGLVGLMLACLLAALMSSADTYMLVGSALLVRNVYAPYIEPNASEKTYVRVGRLAGLFIIGGAVFVAVTTYNVVEQYVMALELAASFAAPFWVGMFWRRATKWAAWATIAFSVTAFFIAPLVLPIWINSEYFPERVRKDFLVTNHITTQATMRPATNVDVERREAQIRVWDESQQDRDAKVSRFEELLNESFGQQAPTALQLASELANNQQLRDAQQAMVDANSKLDGLGPRKEPLVLNEPFEHVYSSGGTAVFWSGGLVDSVTGQPASDKEVVDEREEDNIRITESVFVGEFSGKGRFNVEYVPYYFFGTDFEELDNATLKTLRFPPKLLTPFLVMILVSLITPRCRREGLDRYYAKMKTEVVADREQDALNLEMAYANRAQLESRKLFPWSDLEFLKPRVIDIVGFVVSVGICLLFIQLILYLASLGA